MNRNRMATRNKGTNAYRAEKASPVVTPAAMGMINWLLAESVNCIKSQRVNNTRTMPRGSLIALLVMKRNG